MCFTPMCIAIVAVAALYFIRSGFTAYLQSRATDRAATLASRTEKDWLESLQALSRQETQRAEILLTCGKKGGA